MSKKEGQKGYKVTKNREAKILRFYEEMTAFEFMRKMHDLKINKNEWSLVLRAYLQEKEDEKLSPEDNGMGTYKISQKPSDFEDF